MTMMTTTIDADVRVLADRIAVDGPRPPTAWAIDPLDEDLVDDEVVVTTRRGICRVALVAAEAAGRFQREGLAYDPLSWMLAPRMLFGGVPALDACLDRDACLRGVLVHGLSLGLDIDPATLDALTSDDGEDDGGDGDVPGGFLDVAGDLSPASSPADVQRLFSATVVASDGFETVQAFHASLATSEAEIAGRLYMRMGAAAADAVIREGFDASDPLVEALVAPAIADALVQAAADPDSTLAAGLDLNIEQRFWD